MKEKLLKRWWVVLICLFLTHEGFTQTTYYWNGGASASWTEAASWSPERVTPHATDILQFDFPDDITVTDVPTQTVRSVLVTEGVTVNLRAAVSNRLLTVTETFQVDKECKVTISESTGNIINVNIAGGATASTGGVIVMNRGTFTMQGNSTLILGGVAGEDEENDYPINRVNGQFSLSTSSTLQFGRSQDGFDPQVKLPDNIFLSTPTVSKIIMNNENGAVLGNQSIVVNDAIELISGVLKSNASGRINLASTATSPVENAASYIDGYVEFSKTVGTGAFSFMGLEMEAGPDNLGNVSVERRTGPVFFNGAESVASVWSIEADNQPEGGRILQLSWVGELDNGNDASVRFQVYRYDNGPEWEPVGPLALLSENADGKRKTVSVTTTHFSDWTVADEFNPLPVTWLDFYGTPAANAINLTWKTATEENTDIFSIEKIVSDTTFASIGQVTAAGNSRTVKTYTFTDSEPVYGINYYRIRQADLDGRYAYSKIISVQFRPHAAGLYTVFPVPAHKKLTVRRNSAFTKDERITLLDPFGREVFSKDWHTEDNMTFEDMEIAAGLYRLVITLKSGERYNQMIVIR